MPSKSPVFLALAAGASLVSAHGFVSQVTVDGKVFQGYPASSAPYENPAVDRIAWSETATDNGFVAPDAFASGDIICHRGAKNAALTANIAAGGSIDIQWNTWPESHKGPVINYLADCGGDCSTVDKSTLQFFKIAESGLIDGSASPGTWASDELIANNLTQTVTIPSSLKAGNYVLRHEIIALHSGNQANGAQNYPQCFNLEVTGSGSELPSGTLGTALYKADDAGILFNIYQTLTSYTIPGPALAFAGSGSGSGSGSAATTAVTAASSTTVAAASTSAAATSAAATTSKAATTSTVSSPSASKTPCKKRRSHARDVKKN
ncbi:hypothetical protein JX265_012163 [Neoarthrinium moseri]|uniref:lytic cellulose monooxygenase (C4-dehydrogenating) n=1 Tax=Neoarthrinium moseri TaxID=1658444 RepID=A0A9P9WB42_9PEZI|nr:hypothetical protein JX265_012163 [Neoarthrinium moseri]